MMGVPPGLPPGLESPAERAVDQLCRSYSSLLDVVR